MTIFSFFSMQICLLHLKKSSTMASSFYMNFTRSIPLFLLTLLLLSYIPSIACARQIKELNVEEIKKETDGSGSRLSQDLNVVNFPPFPSFPFPTPPFRMPNVLPPLPNISMLPPFPPFNIPPLPAFFAPPP